MSLVTWLPAIALRQLAARLEESWLARVERNGFAAALALRDRPFAELNR